MFAMTFDLMWLNPIRHSFGILLLRFRLLHSIRVTGCSLAVAGHTGVGRPLQRGKIPAQGGGAGTECGVWSTWLR